MTPSQLKSKHLQAFPESHFFSRENMRFSGDTMANYGVRETAEKSTNGEPLLELYRRKAVKFGLKKSAYFSAVSFKRIL